MSESYFQAERRKELARMREMLERYRKKLKGTPHYQRHPGRVDSFLLRAESELDHAEQIIPHMDDPHSQKAHWIAFLDKLRLAENFMVMAEADAGVVRDRELQAARRKPRLQEVNDWLDEQLTRNPRLQSPELWKRFVAYYDSINDDPPIRIDRFRKRATASRQRLGISKKRRK